MTQTKTLWSRMIDVLPLKAGEGGVVFAGDIVSKFLTFLITLILFRLVTPADYKLYGVFITLLATLSQFTDSGLHQSFIRFYALNRHTNPGRAEAYLQVSFRVKCLFILFTALIVYLGAEVIAVRFLSTPELVGPTRLLALAVAANGMFEFLQSVFQAGQQFRMLTGMRVSEGIGKLLLIVITIPAGMFSLHGVYWAYIITPLVIGIWVIHSAGITIHLPAGPSWRRIGHDMFTFGRWMMLTSFATMFLMRIDVFMITSILSGNDTESGLYIAATRLCTPLVVFAGSVVTIFFPKAMELRSMAHMKAYIRASLRVTIPLAFISLVYLGILTFIIPTHFPNYSGAIPLFAVLSVGYVWTILGNPLTLLVLSINKAWVASVISVIQLGVTAFSHYWFIHAMGAMGAAVSTVLIWFAAGIVSLVYLYKHRHAIEKVGEDLHAA